jgi:hypothetical protein
MAIGPDGQEARHVGMASFPHPASSRARPSAPTIIALYTCVIARVVCSPLPPELISSPLGGYDSGRGNRAHPRYVAAGELIPSGWMQR